MKKIRFVLGLVLFALRPTVALFCAFGLFMAIATLHHWLAVTFMILYVAYFFTWPEYDIERAFRRNQKLQ